MITCENCGIENIEGTVYCDNCGSELSDENTVATDTESTAMMELPFETYHRTALFHQRSGEIITLPESDEIIVGREDPVSGIFPDVDTSILGGEEDGVSRRHAKISFQDDKFYVEDLNSVNFTYLNQTRLEPNEPAELNDGDELMFGRLKFTVQMN